MSGVTFGTPLEQTFDYVELLISLKYNIQWDVLCVLFKSKGEIIFQHFHLKNGSARLHSIHLNYCYKLLANIDIIYVVAIP